jgi:DNA-binding response OmpR family regulator
MPSALICSHVSLADGLRSTLLWRHDFERHVAVNSHKALGLARRLALDLLLVDADMPLSVDLVRILRSDPATAKVSVAVLTRGGPGPRDREFLDAGATEILRLPADTSWNERLLRLMPVTARRQTRQQVTLDVEAVAGGAPTRATALNVSAGGMLIECSAKLAVGDQIRISFALPSGGKRVSGTAWVVRAAGPGCWGIEFFYLEDDGLDRVRRFVESAAPP